MAWELAATWRGYGWAGVGIGDKQARFWGVAQMRRAASNVRLIDFVCHGADIPRLTYRRVLRSMNRGLRLLAGLVLRQPQCFQNLRAGASGLARMPVQPRAIITTSEVLSPDDRAIINKSFRSPVFDEYGCGELGTIAHECPAGKLHTSDGNMIVEILDGDRPCRPGEKGEIVVTELNNLALPLVRYRSGDFGSFSKSHVPADERSKFCIRFLAAPTISS